MQDCNTFLSDDTIGSEHILLECIFSSVQTHFFLLFSLESFVFLIKFSLNKREKICHRCNIVFSKTNQLISIRFYACQYSTAVEKERS